MLRLPGLVVAVPLLVLMSGLAAQAQMAKPGSGPLRQATRSRSARRSPSRSPMVLSASWSRNRDLTVNPRREGEPMNALPKAYVKVDGKTHPDGAGWVRKLTYRE